MLVDWNTFLAVVVLGMAAAPAVMVISRSKITKGIRKAIGKRSKFFGGLISCPFCTSVWVAAFAVAAFRVPSVLVDKLLIGIVASWLLVILVTAPCAWLVFASHLFMEDPEDPDKKGEETQETEEEKEKRDHAEG